MRGLGGPGRPAAERPAPSARLDDYLARVRFEGRARPTVDTLVRVHHQHLLHIPYENLSVQLGDPLDLDVERTFTKIVHGGRGGWCYEMNGLLQWALERIGFEVTRMAAGVLRSERGDRALGNHLVLAVEIDGEPWLADVGFGDGLREPVPLREGPIRQRGLGYALERIDGGYWRFHNHEHGGARDFDFRPEPADEALLERQCGWLQSSPESGFVQNLVCQTFQPEALQVLRGRVRRELTSAGTREWMLDDAAELQAELGSVFGLDVDVTPLWPRIAARHRELFGQG